MARLLRLRSGCICPVAASARDLDSELRRASGTEIALFLSLEKPTKGMVKDAASAGFYESPNGKKYARVQLLTVV